MVGGCMAMSKLIVAVVSRLSGVKPAPCSWKASFIVKQPACAAATSSSGLVPTPFSKRERKEYGGLFKVVLWVERVPFPSFPVPCQLAFADRFIVVFDF